MFRPDVECPAELPVAVSALKSQQHRWAKGTIQVAKKMLLSLLRSSKEKAPTAAKVEAFVHLTHPMVFVAITLMALLLYPTLYVNLLAFGEANEKGVLAMFVGVSLFALGTASAGVFYVMSQRVQGRSVLRTMLMLPFLMSIGIGLALNNARGVFGAVFGIKSPFVRTPKSGEGGSVGAVGNAKRAFGLMLAECVMAGYTIACCWLSIVNNGTTISLPFLLLFAVGYLMVAGGSVSRLFGFRRRS